MNRYVSSDTLTTLPQRHTPHLELVGRHDLKRLMLHGLGRKPFDWQECGVTLLWVLAYGMMCLDLLLLWHN